MAWIGSVLWIIGVGIISIAVVVGISLGIGWILTLFLPFTFFENTLLGLLAGLTTWIIWNQLFNTATASMREEDEDEEDWEEEEIPESEFWQTDAERTWKNWFRYAIANAIYERLAYLMGPGNGIQRQDLSIHLSDAAVRALKANPPRARRMSINRRRLKQEMVKAGHRPPENPVLTVAAAAVNIELMNLENELREVARNQRWEDLADTEEG